MLNDVENDESLRCCKTTFVVLMVGPLDVYQYVVHQTNVQIKQMTSHTCMHTQTLTSERQKQ